MTNIMESVVTEGGGKFGQVKGYSIGGKTGTSEPSPGNEKRWLCFFFRSNSTC